MRTQPVDVVLADHHGWGGFAACQALGMMARPLGWTLSQHSNNHSGVSMAAMIHLASLIPELTMASDTHYPWLSDDADIIAGGKLPMSGGRMKIPAAPGLGVQLDQNEQDKALIDSVVPDSPAEKAGLKGGDVVIKVGKTEIKSPQELVEAVHATKPGEKIDVVIQREGKEQTVHVTLAAYPEQP